MSCRRFSVRFFSLVILPAVTNLTLSLSVVAVAELIVIRHDRDDALYRSLGEKYPSVGLVGGGTGTLVDPRWVLTAAHVVDSSSPYLRVRFGQQDYPVEQIVIHPDWADHGGRTPIDIALLRLARPVEGIEPAAFYEGDDEVGQRVTFVGWGDGGNGLVGFVPDGQQVLRGAHNRVISADETSVRFRFDAPPNGEDLEGISGPGDSGGPAFVERDGRLYTIGVSSRNSGSGDEHCTYGTIETYARVSTATGWLREVMSSGSPAAQDWGTEVEVDGDIANLPDTPAGQITREFFRAFNTGDPVQRLRFEQAHFFREHVASLDPEQRAQRLGETVKRYGMLQPVGYRQTSNDLLAVRTRSGKTGHELILMPEFHETEVGKLRAMRIDVLPLPASKSEPQSDAASRDSDDPLPPPPWAGAHDAPENLTWHARIAPKDEPGEPLVISGTVYQNDGTTPAPGVLLYIYNANAEGIYATRGDETGNARRHGYLRGWLVTGEKGQYEFLTIRPGAYPDSEEPAHIHMTARPPGGQEEWLNVITFEGDRQIRAPYPGRGGSGIVRLTCGEDGIWRGRRDIVLD